MNKFLNRLSTLFLMLMSVIPIVHLIMYSFSLSADQRLPLFLIVAVLFCWLMFSFWRFSLPGILICLALALLFYQGRSELLSQQFEDIANRMAVTYYNRFVASGYVYSGAEISHTEAMFFVGFVLSALMGLTLNSREDRIFLPLLICLPTVFLCLLVYGLMPGWVMLCLCAFVFLLLSTGRINAPEGNTGKSFLLLVLPVAMVLSLILLFKNPDNYNYEEQKLSLVELAQNFTQELTSSIREGDSVLVNERSPDNSGDESYDALDEQLNINGEALDISSTPNSSAMQQVLMYVESGKSGYFYLRSCSFGSYTGTGWGQAPDYPGDSIPAFSSLAVAASGLATESTMDIRLSNVDSSRKYIPYYCTLDYDKDSYITGGQDQYSLSFYSFDSNYGALTLPAELRDRELSYRQFVYSNYLALPDSTRTSLQDIAAQNSLSGDTVYETVALVAEYVRSRCPYNIDTQPYPSDDYALYFLTQATEGYCVHFATAATAMYRALGLPARMVTGVAFNAQAGVTVTVLGENAHAWTEVYIDGLGWLPVEVTPGSYEGPAIGGTDEETQEQSASPSPETQGDEVNERLPDSTENESSAHSEESEEPWAPGPWLIAFASVLLLFLLVFLRYRIKCSIWKRSLKGSKNKAALSAWRCAKRICSYGSSMPDEIKTAAQKAFYGRGLDSREELDAGLQQLEIMREKTYASLPWYKRLKFRFYDGLK